MHDKILTEVATEDGKVYKDLCLRHSWSNTCYYAGLLQFWNSNSTLFWQSTASYDREALLMTINGAYFPNGMEVQHLEYCGNPTYEDFGAGQRRIVNCKALKSMYLLDESILPTQAAPWFDSLVALTDEINLSSSSIRVYP